MRKTLLVVSLLAILAIALLVHNQHENAKVEQLCQEMGWQSARQVRGIDLCVTVWEDGSVDHALLRYELVSIE